MSTIHPAHFGPSLLPQASDAAGSFSDTGSPLRLPPLRIHALYRVWLN
jgi:hypothetical protein